jgi:hypothetical protein
MIFDSDAHRLEMYRVEYDITATQRKMANVGLPEPLVRRLAAGR